MEKVRNSKWLEIKSTTVNSLKDTSFGKMYKKYSSDITQHGIKLIKCPVQEMKQWPKITVNDDLISELDDSGYFSFSFKDFISMRLVQYH